MYTSILKLLSVAVCLAGAAVLAPGTAVMAPGLTAADDFIDSPKPQPRPRETAGRGRFAPMYEPLARQMVLDYGLKTGVAIDVGSSSSPFVIELARKTEMKVYALDIAAAAMRRLSQMVDEAGLTGRVITVEGDAMEMPFKDNFADLIFSRGCIPFIPDQVQMLRECHRVLKPGGVAYIGHGGFGRLLDPEIRDKLVKWRLGWGTEGRPRPKGWNGPKERMLDQAEQAGIENYRLIKEPDVGWWLEIRK